MHTFQIARNQRIVGWSSLVGLLFCLSAGAQILRYDTYRELAIPPGASFRLGPFYSELRFTQSVGYRYVTTTGEGADRLYGEELGEIKKDGSDFPLGATLYSRNYVLLNPDVDLDVSFQLRFIYYPLDTQDDEWALELADEGLAARYGDFTFRLMREGWFGGYAQDAYSIYATDAGRGFSANIGSEMTLTPYVKARVYTRPSYGVDYIDSRGYRDYQSGQEYEYFQNTFGLDVDWMVARDQNLALSVDRTDTLPQSTDTFSNQRSVIHRAQTVFEQRYEPDWLFGARAGVISRDYPEGDRGSQFQTDTEGFMEGRLTPESTLTAALGYSQAEISDAGVYEEDGSVNAVVGRINLRTQMAPKLWHAFGFSRQLTGGYSAGVDQVDEIRYSIYGAADRTDVGLTTALRDVTPELSAVNAHRDWVTQLSLTQNLDEFWALHFSAAYDQRLNDELDPEGPGAEDQALATDYDTLTLVLGTSYLWTKRTTVSGYVQHVGRVSEDPLLEFERNTISLTAAWVYTF